MASIENITITLPHRPPASYPKGITPSQLLHQITPQLAPQALAIRVNGVQQDLTTPLHQDSHLEILTWEHPAGKAIFWHSTAHLLAEALEALYPNILLATGPPIAQGFYYDIDFRHHHFDATHLPRLEKKMRQLAHLQNTYQRLPISKQDAIAHYQKKANPYKLEILHKLPDGNITLYQQGNLTDLCQGPHIPHTHHIKALALTNIAGAYWMGDTKRKQLTRIYGISFPQATMLQDHLHKKKQAQQRDHRTLGKALHLFTFSQQVGNGLPLWLPKGAFLRNQLTQFLQQIQEKAGYQPVITPHIAQKQLYITSGHYQKYQQDTFRPIQTPHQDETFMLKPMNCPHHCAIYQSAPKSYRDLPLRLAEFGTVYRYEQHGELHGLSRTRGFTQDDAHIFCTPQQVKAEFAQIIDLVLHIFRLFHFTHYQVQISLHDPARKDTYIGTQAEWQAAEKAIQEAVAEKKIQATLAPGQAAFYGPKLDFILQDALRRSWQLGTVQLDYQLPQRFQLTYVAENNQKLTPVIIHRAPFGSLERFIAILLEHTAGKLPLWLLSHQVALLPIAQQHIPYAKAVATQLAKANIRYHLDERSEKVNRKIRDAETQKIPYILLLGDREIAQEQVTVRHQGKGLQDTTHLQTFIQQITPHLTPSIT